MPKTVPKVVTIGLDLAKEVFQVHGIDKAGVVVLRRKLRRGEVIDYFRKLKPCLVGIEACGASHHWARSITALGHNVKIMPAQYVKAYVKTHKNDRADAEAICEAVGRPNMRFVPVKSKAQQAVLMLHRTRDLLTTQKNMLINAFRAHLAEFGTVADSGKLGLASLLKLFRGCHMKNIPPLARTAIEPLIEQIRAVDAKVRALEKEIRVWHRASEQSRRLATIPGIGVFAATIISASVPDPKVFRNGRSMAAWLGLVPKQFSSGDKTVLGPIIKRGNTRLRTLLFLGARNVLDASKRRNSKLSRSLAARLARKPKKVACITLANKMARVAWALLSKRENYKPNHAVAFGR